MDYCGFGIVIAGDGSLHVERRDPGGDSERQIKLPSLATQEQSKLKVDEQTSWLPTN